MGSITHAPFGSPRALAMCRANLATLDPNVRGSARNLEWNNFAKTLKKKQK